MILMNLIIGSKANYLLIALTSLPSILYYETQPFFTIHQGTNSLNPTHTHTCNKCIANVIDPLLYYWHHTHEQWLCIQVWDDTIPGEMESRMGSRCVCQL
eukprot:48080_1